MKRAGLIIVCWLLAAGIGYAQVDVVAATKARHPDLGTSEQAQVDFLKDVAKQVGGGILVKPGGYNCSGYACDIICFPQSTTAQIVDVLGNAGVGGANAPAWGPHPVAEDPLGSRVCEMQPGGTGGGEPPSELPKALAAITARLDAIDARLAGMQAPLEKAAFESFNAAVRALAITAGVDELKARPTCAGPVGWPTFDLAIGIPFIGTARGTATPRGAK